MIPRIIHQIWIGPNEIPPQCKEYAETWKEHHPNWEYKLWTNDNLEELPPKVKAQFDRYGQTNSWALQSDILRYYILWKYGGVYADIDFKCFKSIEPLLPETRELMVVSPHCKVYWIANGLIAVIPHHPILTQIVENLNTRIYHGPSFFARIVKDYYKIPYLSPFTEFEKLINTDAVLCAHPSFFFYKNPNAYAIHYALRSWSMADILNSQKNSLNNQSLSGMPLPPTQ